MSRQLEFMLIAGEASGDKLAAELVIELQHLCAQSEQSFAPKFFGAGGPEMAKAGVEIVEDMTAHSAVGLLEVLRKYSLYRAIFNRLLTLAQARQPDVIICVDFSGFNRRFGHAVRQLANKGGGPFHAWNPKIIQYVSPQVWASRPARAAMMAEDFNLLLSIFPFEKKWYAEHAPKMRIEYVGHPMLDRHRGHFLEERDRPGRSSRSLSEGLALQAPMVLLLPGSRTDEVRRHLPVIAGAAQIIAANTRVRFRMVLPNQTLVDLARPLVPKNLPVEIVIGHLAENLSEASVAIASTGTVTMECALFGVPTVALYKTSWPTYFVGRMIVNVDYLAMPNLMRDEQVFPEFIQQDATAENISSAALEFLVNPAQRIQVRAKLLEIVRSLGGPGAAGRGARAIMNSLTAL